MIKSHIEDGLGSGEQVQVKDNSLVVTQYPCPPLIPQKSKIFRQYMTVDGLTSGSNDMGIDGSVTAVKFWVPADDEVDRYITRHLRLCSRGVGVGGYSWCADKWVPVLLRTTR